MNVQEVHCPSCDKQSLRIRESLTAKPLGTFSLSGGQMKLSAVSQPVLECLACGMYLPGVWDGRHAVFSPSAVEPSSPAVQQTRLLGEPEDDPGQLPQVVDDDAQTGKGDEGNH